MVIETLYSVGDEVYFFLQNKVQCGRVTGLEVGFYEGYLEDDSKKQLFYEVDFLQYDFLESDLYQTREELIRHLDETSC